MTEYHIVTFKGKPSARQLERYLELKNLCLQVRVGALPREALSAEADIALPHPTLSQPEPRRARVPYYQMTLPLQQNYVATGESP